MSATHFQEPARDAVRQLLAAMAGRQVLVAGDAMLDAYVYGSSSRLSPEAPVQIVQVEREESLLGGAANVAKCLVALGARVSLACIVGTDSGGEQFVQEARSLNIDTSLVLRDSARPTTIKTRIVSGRQHVLRVDRESRAPYPKKLLDELAARVKESAASADAVLLSDYDKGVLTTELCQGAIAAALAAARPVLADPKGAGWSRFGGATVLKPNWLEAQAFLATRDSMLLTSAPPPDDAGAEQIAHQLRQGLDVRNVLVTRAERGLSLALEDGGSLSFPARAAQVADEAGAGDAVGAVACLALAAGADMATAAWLGNVAAAAKVSKFGTHPVADHDILEALGEQYPRSERKLLSAAQAAALAVSLRAAGKRVVFTNGCFDCLHLGHTLYLEKARRLGGALIVGINTDASVRRLKGPERPINGEGDRARVIASQECVDGVVLFAEDTPLELIRTIRPDVLCKGADYARKEDVVGWDVVESYGGRVELVDYLEGRSTSKLIEKFRGAPGAAEPQRLAQEKARES